MTFRRGLFQLFAPIFTIERGTIRTVPTPVGAIIFLISFYLYNRTIGFMCASYMFRSYVEGLCYLPHAPPTVAVAFQNSPNVWIYTEVLTRPHMDAKDERTVPAVLDRLAGHHVSGMEALRGLHLAKQDFSHPLLRKTAALWDDLKHIVESGLAFMTDAETEIEEFARAQDNMNALHYAFVHHFVAIFSRLDYESQRSPGHQNHIDSSWTTYLSGCLREVNKYFGSPLLPEPNVVPFSIAATAINYRKEEFHALTNAEAKKLAHAIKQKQLHRKQKDLTGMIKTAQARLKPYLDSAAAAADAAAAEDSKEHKQLWPWSRKTRTPLPPADSDPEAAAALALDRDFAILATGVQEIVLDARIISMRVERFVRDCCSPSPADLYTSFTSAPPMSLWHTRGLREFIDMHKEEWGVDDGEDADAFGGYPSWRYAPARHLHMMAELAVNGCEDEPVLTMAGPLGVMCRYQAASRTFWESDRGGFVDGGDGAAAVGNLAGGDGEGIEGPRARWLIAKLVAWRKAEERQGVVPGRIVALLQEE